LEKIEHDAILKQLNTIIGTNPDIAMESVEILVKSASAERIQQIIASLSEQLELLNKEKKNKEMEDAEKSTETVSPGPETNETNDTVV
jgi:hypothetical protein